MSDGSKGEDDEDWDYYFVHDSLGVSHLMRTRKGAHPAVRCVGCDE